MVRDKNKTKKQLLEEIETLRQKVSLNELRRQSETQWQSLLEYEYDFVSLIDRDGNIKYVSPLFEKVSGYTVDEMLGSNAFKFMHPDDAPNILGLLSRLLETPKVKVSAEFRMLVKDGSWHRNEAIGVNLLDDPEVGGIVINTRDISKARRLRDEDKRYRELVENIYEGIWVLDENAVTTFANPRMAEMLGYTVEEMMGKHLFSFMDEEWVKKAQYYLERRQQGIKEQHEFEFLRKDHSHVYAMLGVMPLMDEAGCYRGSIAGVQDITNKKKDLKALQISETKYRKLVENALTGVGLSRGNQVLYANPALLKIFGYDDHPEEFYKIPLLEHVAPASRGLISKRMENLKQGLTDPPIFEYQILRRDGQTRILQAATTHVEEAGGNATFTTFMDITEHKREEEARQRSEQQYRLTVDAINDMIHVIDTDFKIILFNQAFHKKNKEFGLATEALGKNLFEVFPFLDQRVKNEYRQVFATGRPLVTQDENIIGAKKYFTETTKIPIFQGEKVIQIVTVVHDITDLIQLTTELNRRNRELEGILYSASHDLKSPLFTIKGYAELLKDESFIVLPPEAKNFIDRIDQAGKQLLTMINDLVKITAAERASINPQFITFQTVIERAMTFLSSDYLQKGVAIEWAEDFPLIYADPDRLVQVLENLLSNAVRYMGDTPHPRIMIGWRRENSNLIFSIKDNGIGIAPHDQEKIFDPFIRIGSINAEGSGIGLTLAKLIVEQHGGKIWLESSPGKGSTFYFSLPEITELTAAKT